MRQTGHPGLLSPYPPDATFKSGEGVSPEEGPAPGRLPLPAITGHLSPCSTHPVGHQVRKGPLAGRGRAFSREALGSGVGA